MTISQYIQKTSPVGCQELPKCVAPLTQTIGNVIALSVSVAETSTQNNFKAFSTPKIRQKKAFWRPFQLENFMHGKMTLIPDATLKLSNCDARKPQ